MAIWLCRGKGWRGDKPSFPHREVIPHGTPKLIMSFLRAAISQLSRRKRIPAPGSRYSSKSSPSGKSVGKGALPIRDARLTHKRNPGEAAFQESEAPRTLEANIKQPRERPSNAGNYAQGQQNIEQQLRDAGLDPNEIHPGETATSVFKNTKVQK